MRIQNILFTALSIFNFAHGSVTNSTEPNSTNAGAIDCEHLEYDNKFTENEVAAIAEKINITKCQAKDILTFVLEGNAFFDNAFEKATANEVTISQCKTMCVEAGKKYKNFYGKPNNDQIIEWLKQLKEDMSVNELVENCKMQCNILNEFVEDNQESNENLGEEANSESIEKRRRRRRSINKRNNNKKCDPISKSNIIETSHNFQYGFSQFKQGAGSVTTPIELVNGCGPKFAEWADFSNVYKGLFLPACNSHDTCYMCQKGKTYCDDQFLRNMEKLCDKKNDPKKHNILNSICKGEAKTFYKAVDMVGAKAYKRGGENYNNSLDCALCGNTIVKNILVKDAFYVKK